ncbi:MAG: glycosyl hydrolase 115 family protein [Prolixibacteraceae bacterium]|nr:glycosyl hydrolase 115 family protein [Prolixibacteraceae bacterium]
MKVKINQICFAVIIMVLAILHSGYVHGSEQSKEDEFVTTTKSGSSFAISEKSKVAPIVVGNNDFEGVRRVAKYFQADVKNVTNIEPEILVDRLPDAEEVIIAGTIGHSQLIDDLIAKEKINIDDVAGKWESSVTEVIDDPYPGIKKALVIAGSDKRGTIYGIFELSKQMGVSPWYFWADVPVKKNENIYVKKGRYVLGEPKVKYRGIFLNDEEPALGQWAIKNYGGFTHEFYEKVFELVLRLKGNYMWPAMWWAAFSTDDPMNPILADEMGIVMGTSHHEPMTRNQAEWKPWGGNDWNYETNDKQLREFWTEGIERMGNRENIVTIAMRGDGDVGMSEETNVSLLQQIVEDQRKIIEEVTGKPASKTPQLWALYKEVQDYYEKGMRVPDDVTLLLCDDNWGNVRKLPEPNEKRSGGYGMYYHFDFVGGPRNYKWLNTNIIPRIWEQMHLTYEHGVDRIWIVNVGDLKPMELPISFFLDYAWDPDAWTEKNLDEYTLQWAIQQFGNQYAEDIAEILDLYTKYNWRRTPEMLDARTYNLDNYREFETVVNDYSALEKRAKAIYDKVDEDQKDAFYQLVYHPVQACSNLYELYYAHALNQRYAQQGRAATNNMAARVKELFEKDAAITEYFHNDLVDGKWDHMMAQTHIGYRSWQQPDENIMPRVQEIEVPDKAEMRVAIEGEPAYWPNNTDEAVLPTFSSFYNQPYFIEIFNAGSKAFNYEIIPGDAWIELSNNKGSITNQERIEVNINWEKLPAGINTSEITVKSNNNETVIVKINAKKFDEKSVNGFVEKNGYVSIEATNYSNSRNGDDIEWMIIPGLGRTGSGITTSPVTKSIENPGDNTPVLEYQFYLNETPLEDKIELEIQLAPTLNFKGEEGLKFAVSIDNDEPQIINMHEGTEVQDWKYPRWFNDAVSNKTIVKQSVHNVSNAGLHTLKLWMIDNGIVYQRIIINNGGLKPSYMGPPESLKL